MIISHNALSDTQNNGKTITSLFQNWPPDKLAQLYFWPELPSQTLCTNFYRITDYEILNGVIRFNKASGTIIRDNPKDDTNSALGGIAKRLYQNKGNHDGGSGLHKLIYHLFHENYPSAILCRDFFWNTGAWKTNKLKDWLDEFAPEAVFFQSSNCCFAFNIVNTIADQYQIPIVMQVTDDYVTAKPLMSPFGWIHHIYLRNKFKALVNRAYRVLTIGDAMKEEYSRRFGGHYDSFMNCVEVHNTFPQKTLNNSKIRFMYAGSLHTNRWKTLSKIGNVLANLKAEGITASFDIFCNNQPVDSILKAVSIPDVMQYRGSLNAAELADKMQEYDVLVHIEAFDKKSIHTTRLSLSTKIPEYMAAGVSVLAVGPSAVASIGYIQDNHAGIVVTEKDIPQLEDILKRIITDEAFRNSTVQNAYQLAKARHNAADNRERIKQYVFEAVNGI